MRFKQWEARRYAQGQQTFNWGEDMPEPERIVVPPAGKKRSPIIQQWEQMKKQRPDMLILFRVGDFYEMFGEDAEKAAKLLGITLTKRGDFPMAGFPYHVLEKHLKTMLQAGLRVAIAEEEK